MKDWIKRFFNKKPVLAEPEISNEVVENIDTTDSDYIALNSKKLLEKYEREIEKHRELEVNAFLKSNNGTSASESTFGSDEYEEPNIDELDMPDETMF